MDEEYMALLSSYQFWIMPGSLISRFIPNFVRGAIGSGLHRYLRQRLYGPIKQKISQAVDHAQCRVQSRSEHDREQDGELIQWYLQQAKTMPDPAFITDLDTLCSTIIFLNTAAGPIALFATGTINNILQYEHVDGLVTELRQEITQAHSEDPGEWSWAKLEKLKLLDSVVQESLRLDMYGGLNFERVVMEAINIPDGPHLEKGTIVVFPNFAVHRDPGNYEEPDIFQPHRFVKAPGRLYDISGRYLPSGYGRRTCPGRWYGTAMIKLILAQLITRLRL
ncbi:Cytochrome P450 monooxygenase verB [Fulvia fulva]|nr:Cytochrome P450 monooxygenase verB [Fulvia fulva]KAK4615007.1 Cytochrome P450 monooxygenase verB [Fulvia fulva]WPV19777.1 Cytochrome P450 monooxygenase verB [Fulvia fulva]WPV35526.1 Cytochrome P450 monooxygenase verB [Fulvia fulva]